MYILLGRIGWDEPLKMGILPSQFRNLTKKEIDMSDITKGFAAIVGLIVLVLALTWVFQGNDFFLYRYFAPKQEQVRREVFEQSKAYRQGMVQELQNMQFQYEQADDEHKAALADLILHRAADVPEDALTPDLRAFIAKLKQEKTKPHWAASPSPTKKGGK